MFMIDINFPYRILHFDHDNLKNLCMETTLDTAQVVVLTKQSRILRLKIYNYQQPLENKLLESSQSKIYETVFYVFA